LTNHHSVWTTVAAGIGGNGTVFSIFIQPQLTINSFRNRCYLTWPTNYTGFTLQSTTNVVSPAVWTTNSPAPVIVNGQNTITKQPPAPEVFPVEPIAEAESCN